MNESNTELITHLRAEIAERQAEIAERQEVIKFLLNKNGVRTSKVSVEAPPKKKAGRPWTAARRRKFSATMKKVKAAQKAKAA